MNQVEIVAPAGSVLMMKAVYKAGADAAYIGGNRFGARAFADNAEEKELLEAIDYSHIHGRRLYLTVNTLLKNTEIERELTDFLRPLYEQGIDAVIVQDMGVLDLVREYFPDLTVHASTQMTVCGADYASWLSERGVKRIILPRELSFDEISLIKKKSGLETEVFVHGAICYCYSGQCLMSSMIGGRSGNRGRCAQPCRKPYTFTSEGYTESGFLLNMKDLCGLESLPQIIESGADSLKIEGRMKRPEYASMAVAIYRKYIDLYMENGRDGYSVNKTDLLQLQSLFNRGGYTQGYFNEQSGRDMIVLKKPSPEEAARTSRKNEPLMNDIYSRYVEDPVIREPLTGSVRIEEGKPSETEIKCGRISVTSFGPAAEKAQNHPLTSEQVRERFNKTGETEFEFKGLDVSVGDDCYLSVREINGMRRDALDMVTEHILSPFRRKQPAEYKEYEQPVTEFSDAEVSDPMLCVMVSDINQLKAVLEFDEAAVICYPDEGDDRSVIYASDMVHSAGRKFRLALPYIMRQKTEDSYGGRLRILSDSVTDEFLVRNMESYLMLRRFGSGQPCISDYNIYGMNDRAVKVWLDMFDMTTLPAELNRSELSHLKTRSKSEWIIYGRMPLMVSAQCLAKTSGHCSGTPGWGILTDRMQKKFPVYNNCFLCSNIIYNSSPLYLIDFAARDFDLIKPGGLRIQFTDEDCAEVKQVMREYRKAFADRAGAQCSKQDFTRGHYGRGVE